MNRVVIVTGASRGIGAAIAQWFIANGDHVIGISRSGDAPEGCVKSYAVDVKNSADLDAAMKSVVEEFGAVEVAVINAGITNDGLAVRMKDEQWRDVLSVNLDGAFYTARSALSSMLRQRRGSLIFIGSISPFLGIPGQANYAAAKAGVAGLARSLAKEVARRHITVNVETPGFIETDMTADLAQSRDAVEATIPLGRVGSANDVAGLVGFLASDEARYVTGAIIPVDGGLAMGL